jgi:opacity protein-like surface antigen
MQKLTLILALVAITFSAQSQSVESSKIRAGAGVVYATDINNLGLALKGVYSFTPEWEAAFGFTHILKKDYLSYNVVDLDAHYIFSQSGDQLSFFAIAGLAINMWKIDYPDDWGFGFFEGGSATGSDIGLNLGAGMNYFLSSNFRLVPEVRFTMVEGSYARIGATAQYAF